MSERVMIGSRADVERHIDDIIGRLPGVVWVRVLTRAYDAGRSVEHAIADADQAMAAYRQRLTARGEVKHD